MKHKMVTGKEKASYGLYFLGQNIFYMLMYMFLNTYFTDIGITTGIIAIIFLTVKVWDAINDPIFGALMDKIRFKKGKFVPWLRISLIGIPLSTVILFAIPVGVPMGVKIAWAVIGYMLWDTSYTLCDVPIFGLVTTITDVQEERTSLQAIGRICAMLAAMSVMIVVPGFRQAIGGWTETIIMLSVIGAITMLPICFTAKERVAAPVDEEQPSYGIRDMFNYLKTNKYLVIYFAAFLVQGTLMVTGSWGMYIARYCLGTEKYMTITSILGIAPTIVLGSFVPLICKKVDKFVLFRGAVVVSLVLNVIKYFVGYQNIPAYLAMAVLGSLPLGFTSVLMFMFTPDCAEYGCYKTGNSMPWYHIRNTDLLCKASVCISRSIRSVCTRSDWLR